LTLFLPTHLLPPTHIYIKIKSRLFLIYLLTYKFKMCYSHLHHLPILHLFIYLPALSPSYLPTL
jgi:hypothetical protein